MQVDHLGEARSRSAVEPPVTPCSQRVDLYLHPLLEEPPVRSAVDRPTWRRYLALVEEVRGACAACPLLVECLYKAVAQSDIAGYVGCTTPAERRQIRRHLGVTVDPEDLDSAAGTRGTRRPVDHDDVLRARAAFPDDSLEMLGQRLGCSLSTVKRHLRRARAQPSSRAGGQASEPPTVDAVLDAFERVVERPRIRTA